MDHDGGGGSHRMVPPTTVREDPTTSVMDRFVYAKAYCVPILPRQRRMPPATANPTEGPLSCNSIFMLTVQRCTTAYSCCTTR